MRAIIPHRHTNAHLIKYPLPASVDDDGLMMMEWQLSEEDRDKLICGGNIRLWVYTEDFTQPIAIEALDPENNVVKES